MKAALLALMVLLGCAENPALRLRVRSPDDASFYKVQPDYVIEACGLLEIDCELVDDAYGAVTIQVLNIEGGGITGTVLSKENVTGCRRAGVARPNARTVAHEIGHALIGLGHHEDPDNLMYYTSGYELDDEQRAKISRSLWNLEACL